MANLPLLLTMCIISLVSSLPSTVSDITHQATSTVAKDQVPSRILCAVCENPYPPLPPPPPPVIVLCPPPPSPPPPPVVIKPPPPPKPQCESEACLPPLQPPMPLVPPGPPMPVFPPPGSYYPPAALYPPEPDYDENNGGGNLMPAMRFWNPTSYSTFFTTLQSLTFVAFLSFPYYLFV